MRLARWLLGDRTPIGFSGTLSPNEHVLAAAQTSDAANVVVTQLGLWIPDGETDRRIGWHLISKAAWADGILTVIEADEVETIGSVVILRDKPPVSFSLQQPGKVPLYIRQRVDSSIRGRHRQELSDGGIWFVERKIPGVDRTMLQARPDSGVTHELVVAIARDVSAKRGGASGDRAEEP